MIQVHELILQWITIGIHGKAFFEQWIVHCSSMGMVS